MITLALHCLLIADWAYQPVEHFKEGMADTAATDSLVILALGTTATAISFRFDNDVKDQFLHHDRWKNIRPLGNIYGSWPVQVGMAAAGLGLGFWADSRILKEGSTAHLEALAITMATSTVLKFSTQRARPDESSDLSFPSDHTARSFATAAVYMENYGSFFGIQALGLGVISGMARIASNKHHLSDVVAGATLGYFFGNAFAKHHSRALLVPSWDRENGVQISFQMHY